MTCEKATATLEARLRDLAVASGAPWTEGLVVKTSTLDTQRYWHAADAARCRQRPYRPTPPSSGGR